MTNTIKQRSEILFLYDVTEANPNGDPLELNAPRLDPDTGHNLVTDVRLKRTVRDYLFAERGYNGEENAPGDIFVREVVASDGSLADAKRRAKSRFGNTVKEIRENILSKCVDIRLFGATIPTKDKGSAKRGKAQIPESDATDEEDRGNTITLTGPVQFRLARSLNRVEVFHVKGSGVFASGEDKQQGTFREEDFVHYSLIPFYGAINPIAAKDTGMTAEDEALLVEALWFGTKHLHSRSKLGHTPRLLLKVNYAEQSSFVGELQRHLKLGLREGLVSDKDIRSVEDYEIEIDSLLAQLQNALNGQIPFGKKVEIASIQVAHDPALRLTLEEQAEGQNQRKRIIDLGKELKEKLGVNVEALSLGDGESA